MGPLLAQEVKRSRKRVNGKRRNRLTLFMNYDL